MQILRFYDWCASEADRLARACELRCEAHWLATVATCADRHGRTPLHYAAAFTPTVFHAEVT